MDSTTEIALSLAELQEPLHLGPVELPSRLLAAPICGASKIPYRVLARRFGADLAFTEMLKALPLSWRDERTLKLAEMREEEHPVGVQICGADPAVMADAARVAEDLGFDLLDINMGCPVRKVVKEGAGAALLKNPAQVERIVSAVAGATRLPVTVKLRSGWDGEQMQCVDVARAAEAGGARMVTVHGRTRAQRHSGGVDYASIARTKRAVSIPVCGNGSIEDGLSARRMFAETGCDAVMVGRGAFGAPWVFAEVRALVRGEAPPPRPCAEEILDLARWHHQETVAIFGEACGNRVWRKFAAWYVRGAPCGNHFRRHIYKATASADMELLLRRWFEHVDNVARLGPAAAVKLLGLDESALAERDAPMEEEEAGAEA